jgi:hypothetical protein
VLVHDFLIFGLAIPIPCILMAVTDVLGALVCCALGTLHAAAPVAVPECVAFAIVKTRAREPTLGLSECFVRQTLALVALRDSAIPETAEFLLEITPARIGLCETHASDILI